MKSRAMTFVCVALAAACWCAPASAQVLKLGHASTAGGVTKASCDSCAGGYGSGTVWGTSCIDCNVGPGLYPPCPNPCRTTLLGELVCDVKNAVDTSLSHLFCCLLGNSGYPCGSCANCCDAGCGAGQYGAGCGVGDYGVGDYGVGCDGSCDGGYVGSGVPTPASSPVMSQPMGAPAQPSATPIHAQPNPFTDDAPAIQPIPGGSASRNTPSRRAITRRTVSQSVRPVSHTEPKEKAPASIRRAAPDAQPIRSAAVPLEHYQPRRRASLRTTHGATLKKTPIQSGGTPALRFRVAN